MNKDIPAVVDERSETDRDKKCPECGASLDPSAEFCSECGRRIDGESKSYAAASKLGDNDRLIRRLSVAPSVLFALYGLLLFVFFAAPVVGTMGIGLDVYALCGETYYVYVSVLMILLIVFAVATLITAVANCYFKLRRTLFPQDVSARESANIEILPVWFYIAYCIIGVTMVVVVIAVFDSPPAACPVFLTVFSAVFAFANFAIVNFKKKLSAPNVQSAPNDGENGEMKTTHVAINADVAKSIPDKKKSNVKQLLPHIFLTATALVTLLICACVPAYSVVTEYYRKSIVLFDLSRYGGSFVADCLYICNWIYIAACAGAVITAVIAWVWSLKFQDGGKIARRALLAFGIIYFLLSVVAFITAVSGNAFSIKVALPLICALACFCIISAAVLIAVYSKKNRSQG